ncbi:MAG: ABC transporter permease [Flavobacteriaceae bacterium]|nr:ABC transporter permease [Flavobacteriaceae bacterium]
MLMVKALTYIDETSAITSFQILEDCIFVANEALSETGLIENAAQSCSAIVGQSYFDDDDTTGDSNSLVGYISAIKKAEIHSLPKVSETIITKARLISRVDTGSVTLCTIASQTFRNEELIVDCTMNFLIHEVGQ